MPLFFAVLGHCCSAGSSLVGESRGSSLAVGGLLNAVASLDAEQGSRAHGLQQLRHTGLVVAAVRFHSIGSIVVTHGLSCSAACGIFSNWVLKPCLLHWQADLKNYLFIYFNWRLNTLQYCSGFCHTLTWISHRCTCVLHPEPPSHLPAQPIPEGCPSALALSALFHASNLDWLSILHMVTYMFQCYSLKSSHPRLLPQSPKSILYSCVSCCLAYRFIITIFLNSIYMH